MGGVIPALRLRWAGLGGWQRLAVVLWTLIVLAGCGRGLLSTASHVGIYNVYGDAGRHWRAGQNVYAEQDGWYVFPYSPLIAVYLVPFSFLPDNLGSCAWRLANVLIFLAALARWTRVAPPRPLRPAERALLFLLVIPLTATSVVNGQAGMLVVSTLLLGLADAAEERWTRASFFIMLSCLIKAYVVSAALLLAVCYPRRCAARLVMALLLLAAVPFLFQDPGYVARQYVGWVKLMWSSDRHDWHINIANRDLTLLFRVWLVPLQPRLHLALQLLGAAGVAVLCLAGRRADWSLRHHLVVLFALAGCWMTLLGPVVESFTYILVGPTLAWMLIEAWRQRPIALNWAVLALSWAVFTAATVAVWFAHSIHLHNQGPHPLAGLLFAGCLLTHVVYDLRQQPLPFARGRMLAWPVRSDRRAQRSGTFMLASRPGESVE